MSTQPTQPKALRLALSISLMDTFTNYQQEELDKAADELRRLHALTTTQGTQPTDDEIEAAWTEATGSSFFPYPNETLAFARTVLAKWGTPQPAPAPLSDPRITAIEQAIRDYHYALDCRKHGGVAEVQAFGAICNAMKMDWVQGQESERRAALAAQGGK